MEAALLCSYCLAHNWVNYGFCTLFFLLHIWVIKKNLCFPPCACLDVLSAGGSSAKGKLVTRAGAELEEKALQVLEQKLIMLLAKKN